MADRHITRSGNDYAQAMLNLLPQGMAWPRDRDSILVKLVYGLCQIWGDVEFSASKLLERESDPRQTVDLLPDWERAFGLPDPCYDEPLTIGDRQKALVQRMTIEGGQSRQFFIDMEAEIGHKIRITEYRPFMVGVDAVGDNRRQVYTDTRNADGTVTRLYEVDENYEIVLTEYPYTLGPPELRFYWTIHIDEARLTWFRCGAGGGQCGVDHMLTIGIASDLECLLRRWKPAHTELVFDYGGLAIGGPYAGTGVEGEWSMIGSAGGTSQATAMAILQGVGVASGRGYASAYRRFFIGTTGITTSTPSIGSPALIVC